MNPAKNSNLSGLIDRRVRVDRAASPGNGEPNPIWEPAYEGWGGKADETAVSETAEGKRIVATGRTTWTVRYTPCVLPTMRLIDLESGIIYNIEGVSEGGRKQTTILHTKRYDQ